MLDFSTNKERRQLNCRFSVINTACEQEVDALECMNQVCPINKYLQAVFTTQKPNRKLVSSLQNKQSYAISVLLSKKFTFENLEGPFLIIRKGRRTEDQFKFVLRRGIKRLIKNFKNKNPKIGGSKLTYEIQFYDYYFGESSERNNEPIGKYYLPGSKAQDSLNGYKGDLDRTVSFAYTHRLMSSEKFKKAFTRYLLEGLLEDCVEARNEQLGRISNAIRTEKNKIPNLPWANDEIMEAQRRLLEMVSCLDENKTN